jgi:D-alanine-D-alanine ligase
VKREKLRVLGLMHEDLVPPASLDGLDEKDADRIKTEYDVTAALERLGHEVQNLGVRDELAPLRRALYEWKPHVVFNLLEEFRGQAAYDQNVVSYLELMQAAYTGCNPRGLILARDKALSKKVLHYHRIRAPAFASAPRGRRFRRPRRLSFPLIVKSLVEEASTGIAHASVVHADDKLEERVRFIHDQFETDAIVEEYVPGRELYVGLLGNQRVTVFPPWEIDLTGLPPDAPRIVTRRLKLDPGYQRKHGITADRAQGLADDLLRRIETTSKRIYRALGLDGCARLDFRLGAGGELYFLEANPNPDIAMVEEFASAARAAGFSYDELIQKMLNLGLSRAARIG